MEPRIDAAVVGCGRMGAFTSEAVKRFAPACWFPLSHAEAIRAHPALHLAALADANESALDRALQAYGVTRGFIDYRELVASIRPRLLAIATRTPGRAEIVQSSAAAGVCAFHVEKPLCNSMTELQELEKMFAGDERFLTLGAIRRFFGVYMTARDLAASGEYGELREIRVNMGVGSLYWTHPHSVDLILFVAGDRHLEAVQARLSDVAMRGSRVVTSDPVIDAATLLFTDGVMGHITRSPGADLVLACSRGEITVENDGRSIRIAAPVGNDPYLVRRPADIPVRSLPEGTFAPVAQLVSCLKGDAAARAANRRLRRDIFLGQRAMFAMVESHLRSSRLVAPDEAATDLTIEARTGLNHA
ncbi:MAG: Gfo/Idh/MocA family oxidoreductase [Steroidobacteraceae bacterium]